MKTVIDGESRKIKSYYESKVEIIAISQTEASVLKTLASTATYKDTEPVRATMKKHVRSKDDTRAG
jgi:hypothetical protein